MPIVNRGAQEILFRPRALVTPVRSRGFLVVDAPSRHAYLLNDSARAVSHWNFEIPELEVGSIWPRDALLIRNNVVLAHEYGLMPRGQTTVEPEFPVKVVVGPDGKRRRWSDDDEPALLGVMIAGTWDRRPWAYSDFVVRGMSDQLTTGFVVKFEGVYVLTVLPGANGGCHVLTAKDSPDGLFAIECTSLDLDGNIKAKARADRELDSILWVARSHDSQDSVLIGCRDTNWVLNWTSRRTLSLRKAPRIGEVLDLHGDRALFCEGGESAATVRLLDLIHMKVLRTWKVPLVAGCVVAAGLMQ